ncbi:segregation/condensation protein A [Nannocystis sp. SCPEA4]|uniref:segregation/condensation protein A n=1 Tax=Nannocystis sp. SCPEA4 TaxID=2996787 RepID=UPI00226EE183|nr:segregation/condensation protein A [Nannocystis sp. SCPEA4]MCY1058299.1 segregation/condensation protein A [Nannocystis sp. SCPEA4]
MEQGSTGLGEGAPRARERKGTSSPIYSVELEVFEGPLDLLLHLVRKHELDILDIPIAFVAEKYLEYLDVMRQLDLEIAGDYLVMAATLAYLKSRELLPPEPRAGEAGQSEEEEGEDPREALIRRLVEYERFKQAAAELDSLPVSGRDVFARGAELVMPPIDPGLAPVSLFNLAEAYYRVLTRAKVKSTHEVQIEAVTVAQRIKQLALILDEKPHFEFEELFLGRTWNSERELRAMLVVTLMSILEMVKLGVAGVQQPHDTPNIRIYRRASAEQTQAALADYDEDASFGAPKPKAEDGTVAPASAAATPARAPSEAELDAVEEAALLAEALASVQEPEEPVLGYADESEDVAANDPAVADDDDDAPTHRTTGRPSRERRRERPAVSEDMSRASGDMEDVSEDMWRQRSSGAARDEDGLRGAAWAPERTGAAADETGEGGGTAGTRSATEPGEVEAEGPEAEAVLADSTEASQRSEVGEGESDVPSDSVTETVAASEARAGAEETRGDGDEREVSEAVPGDSEAEDPAGEAVRADPGGLGAGVASEAVRAGSQDDEDASEAAGSSPGLAVRASETAGRSSGEQAGAVAPADREDESAASEAVREDRDESASREGAGAAVRLKDESTASEAVRETAVGEDTGALGYSSREDVSEPVPADGDETASGEGAGGAARVEVESAGSESVREAAVGADAGAVVHVSREDASEVVRADSDEAASGEDAGAVVRWQVESAGSESVPAAAGGEEAGAVVTVGRADEDGASEAVREDSSASEAVREDSDATASDDDAGAVVLRDSEDDRQESATASSEDANEVVDAGGEFEGAAAEDSAAIEALRDAASEDESAAGEAGRGGSEDEPSEHAVARLGSADESAMSEARREDSADDDAVSAAVRVDSEEHRVVDELARTNLEDIGPSTREDTDVVREGVRADSEDAASEAVVSDGKDAASDAVVSGSESDDLLGEAVRSDSEDAAGAAIGSSAEIDGVVGETVGSGSEDAASAALSWDSESDDVLGEAVRSDSEDAAGEAIGSDGESDGVLGEAVRSDSEDAASEAVGSGVESDGVLGKVVRSDSEDAAGEAVGSGVESDGVLGKVVRSDSEDAASEAVGSDSEDATREAVGSDSEDATREAVGSDSEDATREAVGSDSEDATSEAVESDSEDVTEEAVRVDGDEAARAEGSRDASEAVRSDSDEEAVGGLFLNTGEGLGGRELGEVDDEDDAQ